MKASEFLNTLQPAESITTSPTHKAPTNRKRLRSRYLLEREAHIASERQDLIRKRILADEIIQEFPRTNLPNEKVRWLSMADLLRLREIKPSNRQRESAVLKIQKAWKNHITLKNSKFRVIRAIKSVVVI